MAWGGGGGVGGPTGVWRRATADNEPFAGVPAEMATRVSEFEKTEPAHPEPQVSFSQAEWDGRPLTLRRFVAPFKWALLGAFMLVVVETFATRIGPTLVQLGIDRGMGLENLGIGPIEGDKGFLVTVSLLYVFLVGVSVIAGYARTAWSGTVGERLLYALRVRVFAHLQRLPLDFFTREKAGRLMSRMTSDIDNLQSLFHEGIVQLTVQGLTLVILTVQLFLFDVRLAGAVLALVVPVMLVLTIWFQRASGRGYLDVRDRLASVLTDLSESLAGIRLVAATNRQHHNSIHHTNVVGEYKDANDYTAKVSALYGNASLTLGHVASMLALVIGGGLVLRGEMNLGELAGFMLALSYFFTPIQQIAQLYNIYQQGQAGVTRLRELLLEEPSVREARDATDLPPIEGRITFEGVTFAYQPDAPVLHEVWLDVPPGQTLALVGATGAGKSTIAKLATRFYDPTEGRVLIDGHDISRVTLRSLRSQIGVVPQEPFLFNGTIRDNITFGRSDAHDAEIYEVARALGLGELLDRLDDGLDSPVHERGVSLSSGERQLLALARVFLSYPRILILDEATSSLDLKSEQQVERALDVILQGRTAILIAHRLATAMRADTIAVVDGGRIIERGSHAELVAHGGMYAEMYATWEMHAGTGNGRA